MAGVRRAPGRLAPRTAHTCAARAPSACDAERPLDNLPQRLMTGVVESVDDRRHLIFPGAHGGIDGALSDDDAVGHLDQLCDDLDMRCRGAVAGVGGFEMPKFGA